MTLYDYTYIDEKIIGGVEKNLPNVAEILKTIEIRATGKAVSTLSLSETGLEQTKFGETGGLSQSITSQDEPRPKKVTE